MDASVAASGPHVFAVRFGRARPATTSASTAPRPTSVTTADALLIRTGWPNIYTRVHFCKIEIFLILGLDTIPINRTDLPVGLFCRISLRHSGACRWREPESIGPH